MRGYDQFYFRGYSAAQQAGEESVFNAVNVYHVTSLCLGLQKSVDTMAVNIAAQKKKSVQNTETRGLKVDALNAAVLELLLASWIAAYQAQVGLKRRRKCVHQLPDYLLNSSTELRGIV